MLLVVDSATSACSAALLDGDRLLDERFEVVGRGHAERLVPMIADLLAGRKPRAVLVDCGPGSFTGVRVGLAAAHGLAIGWGVPLAGFSSTALIAAAVNAQEVAIALAAGHGQLFVQSYAREPLAATDELRSLAPEEAAASLNARLIAGSGAASLVAARGWGVAIDALPRASDARLLPPGLRELAPRPIYGRAPDAKPVLSGVEGPMP